MWLKIGRVLKNSRVKTVIAIDTSIVVRILTGDDPRQTVQARRLLSESPVFIATTVLLETEWVLRKVYSVPASDIPDMFEAFIALPGVHLEHHDRVARALDAARSGQDLADAFHHAAAADNRCEGFATFDRGMARLSASMPPPIRLL